MLVDILLGICQNIFGFGRRRLVNVLNFIGAAMGSVHGGIDCMLGKFLGSVNCFPDPRRECLGGFAGRIGYTFGNRSGAAAEFRSGIPELICEWT